MTVQNESGITTQGRSKRLLLIAYSFPPVGGAGVQRPVKWVKYLGSFGWNVTVVTAANPSVPVRDESLLQDIPPSLKVVTARTWEPSYSVKQKLIAGAGPTTGMRGLKERLRNTVRQVASFLLQPDPQILWVPNAIRAATRALKNEPCDAVLVTAPPYSSFLVGSYVRRRFRIPLVLDYRDEWDLSNRFLEHAKRDAFSRFVQDRLQQFVMRRADAVVATTLSSTNRLAQKLERLGRKVRTACVYNGYDPDDFVQRVVTESPDEVPDKGVTERAESNRERFRLLYTGTLWNIMDIRPLVEAIEQLAANRPDLLARLEVICIGRKTPEQLQMLRRLQPLPCKTELIDYCDHAQILVWQRSADALLLLLSSVPGTERWVPAKLFEYLASRKAVLGIVPDGEAATILHDYWPGEQFRPDDIGGISEWLRRRLESLSDPVRCPAPQIAREDYDRFSRQAQTAVLAGLLDEVTAAGLPRDYSLIAESRA